MRKINTPSTSKNKILIGASLVALVLLGAGILYYTQHRQPSSATVIQGSIPGEKIDLNPPTEEEKRQAEENKSRVIERQEQDGQTQTPGTKKVTPFISDASQYNQQIEVRSYVPGIFESGGICKATFTKDGQTITKESNAEKNVSDTICHTIVINRSEFPSAGDWSLVLTYTSSTANGSSAPKTVKVN